MITILFVCHGNICRSPMAEFIMKDLVTRAGLASEISIASAAATREEIGRDMYPPAKRKLTEKGVPFSPRAARLITPADYEAYDFIPVMDRENLRHLARLLGPDREDKIHLLLEYAGERREVADPWYTDDFELAYQDIRKGCLALLRHLSPEAAARLEGK